MKLKALDQRQAGILLPLFSLPGKHGIGDLGKEAYEFVDLSAQAGFSIWQILPLNPSSSGNSPYTPYSSFAGDEIYISLELLKDWHLLDEVPNYLQDLKKVDYKRVRLFKNRYLRKAYQVFLKDKELKKEYRTFVKGTFWLKKYARFMALNKANEGLPWVDWNDEDQNIKGSNEGLEAEIDYIQFLQYIFVKQFNLLKIHAHQKGISIMGDLPLYVGDDSADVYEYRKCFQLDDKFYPKFVSGASPDYFSKDGQLWGHPLYDWDYLKKTRYNFWIKRLKWNNEIFDILRVDHFRAFDTYWSVPYGSATAREGKWIEGPSYHFLDSVYKQLPKLNMIVEDLGELRPQVHELRDHYDLLGMKVMQFSFGEDERKVKYKIPQHCVVYTGTHDNDTAMGWMKTAPKASVKFAKEYLNLTKEEGYNWGMMRGAWSSVADMAIVPMQDLIGLGSEARINTPSTLGENWKWRATADQITNSLAKRLYKYMEMYGRVNEKVLEEKAKAEAAKKTEKTEIKSEVEK